MEDALILEPDSSLPVAQIGRILAPLYDLHPTDVTSRVRYGGGILVESAPPATIRDVKERLAEIGVDTRIIPAGALADPTRGRRILRLEFTEDSVLAGMSGGSDLVFDRNKLCATHLYGLVPQSSSDSVEDNPFRARRDRRETHEKERGVRASRSHADALAGSGLQPRARQLLENLAAADLPTMKFHLTLCFSEPSMPVQISKDDFDFSCLGEQKANHSLDNFLVLLETVLEHLPDAWNREPAVEFLQDLDPVKILRLKVEEVNNFDRWLLTRLRLANAAPGSVDTPGDKEALP